MIAIKNMKIPSCCLKCPCAEYTEITGLDFLFKMCGVTKTKPPSDDNSFNDEKMRLDDCPLIEIEQSEVKISLATYKQVAWERDIAIEQLKELGYEFGEKIRTDTDCVSREQALLQLTGVNLSNKTPLELIALFDKRIKALPSVIPTHGRCKECKYWDRFNEQSIAGDCKLHIVVVSDNSYCNNFKRRE